MTFWLMLAGFLGTTNAGRVALALGEGRAPRRLLGTAVAAGAALVLVLVLLAEPLLDALDISPESFRIAAGIVLVAAGAFTLVRPRPSGPAAAVLVTPELACMAIAASADEGVGPAVGAAAIALAVVAALALLPRLSAMPAAAADAGPGAEPWSEARVEALRAEGRPVLVNATAAWCITCQVNERLALRGAAVLDALAARDVAYIKADWTRGDPAVTALLRANGREGVPLYLFWPRGAAAPLVLPQLLTERIVLQALDAR